MNISRTLPLQLSGIVTAFQGNGRKLGYPTANIASNTSLEDGVYFGYATLGKYSDYPCEIFIGKPITMGNSERRVEAHILSIEDKDYYGRRIELSVIFFHRSNIKFDSMEALISAMQADEVAAKSWFANNRLA
jgi:riboflavin kinase/FMN adenylyltransferase